MRFGSISLPAVDAELKVDIDDDRRVEHVSVLMVRMYNYDM